MRILLIGNSQMYQHNLPDMLSALSDSAPADHPRLEIHARLKGGASLQSFWEMGTAPDSPRSIIAQGGWDAVVIQELFRAERTSFETHAALFDTAIRAAGARTILFATAQVTERYDSRYTYPDSFHQFNDMQRDFGKRHGVPVVASGYAWMRYLGDRPDEARRFDLYAPDLGHPGVKGTYIYACHLYAALTGKSPAGLAVPDRTGLDADAARAMQRVAWEQWCADSGTAVCG